MIEGSAGIQAKLLEKVKIVNRREGNLVEAFVPMELIYRQDVPVDLAHVRELAKSIQEESEKDASIGQLSPVLLGEISGFGQFVIIDGFHRVAALELLGKPEVFATIRPDSAWERVIDLRILSATTHKAIRFSRLVEWVEESWRYSPWPDKVKASQAFQLTSTPAMTGKLIGLIPQEVEEIKNWVEKKCEQWHISPTYVYQHLLVAQIADPELIKEARERRSGRKLEAVTPAHVTAIAKILPHKYDFQRLVAKVAKDQVLTVLQTRALVIAVAKAENIEQARVVADSRRWDRLEGAYSRPKVKKPDAVKEEVNVTPDFLERFFEDEMEIARLTIENAILTGRYTPRNQKEQSRDDDALSQEIGEQAAESVVDNSNKEPRLSKVEEENIMLQLGEIRTELVKYSSAIYKIGEEDEDVVSDAPLKVILLFREGKLGREYLDKARLKPLMLRIVRFGAVDRFRKLQGTRRHESPQASSSDNFGENERSEEVIFEEPGYEEIESGESLQSIKKALPMLSREQRRTFILRVFFDLPIFDIAQIQGKNRGTVSVILYNAKKNLLKITSP